MVDLEMKDLDLSKMTEKEIDKVYHERVEQQNAERHIHEVYAEPCYMHDEAMTDEQVSDLAAKWLNNEEMPSDPTITNEPAVKDNIVNTRMFGRNAFIRLDGIQREFLEKHPHLDLSRGIDDITAEYVDNHENEYKPHSVFVQLDTAERTLLKQITEHSDKDVMAVVSKLAGEFDEKTASDPAFANLAKACVEIYAHEEDAPMSAKLDHPCAKAVFMKVYNEGYSMNTFKDLSITEAEKLAALKPADLLQEIEEQTIYHALNDKCVCQTIAAKEFYSRGMERVPAELFKDVSERIQVGTPLIEVFSYDEQVVDMMKEQMEAVEYITDRQYSPEEREAAFAYIRCHRDYDGLFYGDMQRDIELEKKGLADVLELGKECFAELDRDAKDFLKESTCIEDNISIMEAIERYVEDHTTTAAEAKKLEDSLVSSMDGVGIGGAILCKALARCNEETISYKKIADMSEELNATNGGKSVRQVLQDHGFEIKDLEKSQKEGHSSRANEDFER